MRVRLLAGCMFVFVGLGLPACSGVGYSGQTSATRPAEAESHWILGQWRIAREDLGGATLAVVMDSVSNNAVYGHVLRYMAGNFGRGPRDFRPFSAPYALSGPIAVTIQWVDPNPPPISLVFQRVGAELELGEFILGGDDMMQGGRSWIVTRIAR